jgi:hypothetical protein
MGITGIWHEGGALYPIDHSLETPPATFEDRQTQDIICPCSPFPSTTILSFSPLPCFWEYCLWACLVFVTLAWTLLDVGHRNWAGDK